MKKTTLALLLLGAMGCEDCKAGEVLRGTPEDVAAYAAPSAEATDAFFTSLLEAAMTGDASAVDALVDWDAIAARAGHKLELSRDALRDLSQSASSAAKERGISAHLARMSRGEVSIRRLETRARDGGTWLFVRLTSNDGSFDHLAFLLSARGEGARAVDLWQLTLGDSASEMMRRTILPTVSNPILLTSTERDIAGSAAAFIEAEELAANGREHDALHRLDLLPRPLLDERFVLLTRLRYAESASKREHLEELQVLAENFADDPTAALHLVDAFVAQGELANALEAVDRLEANVPPDPYLDVIRANILGAMDRWPEARAASESVIAREPDLEPAYWPALVGSVMDGEFAATTHLLLTMREKFGTSLDPKNVPIYATYVDSPEYQAYVEAIGE